MQNLLKRLREFAETKELGQFTDLEVRDLLAWCEHLEDMCGELTSRNEFLRFENERFHKKASEFCRPLKTNLDPSETDPY